MKQPQKPWTPSQPIEPNREAFKERVLVKKYENMSDLSLAKEELDGINFDTMSFELDSSGCYYSGDRPDIEVVLYKNAEVNESKYKQSLDWFKKRMIDYKKELVKYNSDLEDYEVKMKEYNEWLEKKCVKEELKTLEKLKKKYESK